MVETLSWMFPTPFGFVVRMTDGVDTDSYIAVISSNDSTKIFEKPNLKQGRKLYGIRHPRDDA